MAKISNKEVVARLKKKQEAEAKGNVTFRLNIHLIEDFRKQCKVQKVSMTAVLEELIAEFLK